MAVSSEGVKPFCSPACPDGTADPEEPDDAAQAAKLVGRICPAHVIPMHYRGENSAFGFDVIGTVKEFTDRMDSVAFIGGSSVDLDALPEEQVIVLTPQNAK